MTFEAQAAHAGDARVRAFAARWLPVLRRHQDGAEAVLLDLDHC